MNDSPTPEATEERRSKSGVGICLLPVLGSVKESGGASGRTCPHGSSPFQQKLETVQLAVERRAVQGGVSICGLGIQVATRRKE